MSYIVTELFFHRVFLEEELFFAVNSQALIQDRAMDNVQSGF